MKNHYFIEMTDTFGGEANYCWVNRFIVSASTPRGAMRRVCDRTGDKVYCADRYNEPQTWDSSIGCIRYFVEWIDDARIAELQDKYSRIEVIE
jgi:hypothetical protein